MSVLSAARLTAINYHDDDHDLTMTNEHFKQMIGFASAPQEDGSLLIQAGIVLQVQASMNAIEAADPALVEHVHEEMRDQLCKLVFERDRESANGKSAVAVKQGPKIILPPSARQ